jgi:hypothetical protein
MRVVVPAMHADNVAAACLRAERVDHEVRVLSSEHSYALLLVELWLGGETFAIVEDDIAPHPGAMAALERCPYHWCGHYYCLPGRWDVEEESPHESLFGTNGLFKVSAQVIKAAPDLYQRWATHPWQTLDVAFGAALRHVYALDGADPTRTFHVHNPPVAHAMHYRPEAQHGRDQGISTTKGQVDFSVSHG